MRAVGIIAEYNPFHSGHAYQLARAREAARADVAIVAMSGAFTQRGEAALIDKWTRARMALMNGADIVLELPCLFALREAKGFAEGGVRLLGALGAVQALSFGCEEGLAELIDPVARCLSEEPPAYRAGLRAALDGGLSYPRARAQAAADALGLDASALDRPNFALALEYAQANARLERPLELLPVVRTSDYHGHELGAVCSASAIRAAVARGELSGALAGLPANCRPLLSAALAGAEGAEAPCALSDDAFLGKLSLLTLRNLTPEELSAYPGVGEGLERLICRKARLCPDADALIAACKSKRYTYARLRRLLPQVALGITRRMQEDHPRPTYARVLACRRSALGLLGELKRASSLPLVTDVRELDGDPIWELETRATDLWGLCAANPEYRRAGRDWTHRFTIEP